MYFVVVIHAGQRGAGSALLPTGMLGGGGAQSCKQSSAFSNNGAYFFPSWESVAGVRCDKGAVSPGSVRKPRRFRFFDTGRCFSARRHSFISICNGWLNGHCARGIARSAYTPRRGVVWRSNTRRCLIKWAQSGTKTKGCGKKWKKKSAFIFVRHKLAVTRPAERCSHLFPLMLHDLIKSNLNKSPRFNHTCEALGKSSSCVRTRC